MPSWPSDGTRVGDHPGPTLALWRALLGPSWGQLGAILGVLKGAQAVLTISMTGPQHDFPVLNIDERLWGATWAFLGPSWHHLGASWSFLEASWGRLGAVLGFSWGHLGTLWGTLRHLGVSCALLRPSWRHLRRLKAQIAEKLKKATPPI